MMIYVAYFIFVFVTIQFIIALVNLLFIQRFDGEVSNQDELVSVLIPARNEKDNIGNILSDLIKQKYQNIEVVVFNDQSTDSTEKIIQEFSLDNSVIRYINSTGLPEGWLGKNFACHSLALNSKGKFLLFLDADVRLDENLISRALLFMKKYKLALLTIFPKQVMISFGEKITVPLMHYILLTLLPLILVRKSKYSSLAAANGQFMLFDGEIYREIFPHEKMKKERVEDIEIARFYKRNNLKVACVTGIKEISCRMYKNYNEAISGFAKNVNYFFGNSYLLAFLFWIITTFGWIPVLFYLPFEAFLMYLILIIVTRTIVSFIAQQNPIENLLLMFLQHFALGHIIFKSVFALKNNKLEWKGRKIN